MAVAVRNQEGPLLLAEVEGGRRMVHLGCLLQGCVDVFRLGSRSDTLPAGRHRGDEPQQESRKPKLLALEDCRMYFEVADCSEVVRRLGSSVEAAVAAVTLLS